jgi:hypothetical protein
MGYFSFFIIAFISFVITINETWLKKIISILLCGMINLNSPTVYAFLNDGSRANAALPPLNTNSITQVEDNRGGREEQIYNPQLDGLSELAQLPRVRQQNRQSEKVFSPDSSNDENIQTPSIQDRNLQESNNSWQWQSSGCNLQKLLNKAGILDESPDAKRLKNLYYELLGATEKLNKYRNIFLANESSLIDLFPTAYYNTTIEELRRIQNGDFRHPIEKLEQMQAFFDAYIINRENWDNGLKNQVEPHWAEHFKIAEEINKNKLKPYPIKVQTVLNSGIDAHVGNDLARAIRYAVENRSNKIILTADLKREFNDTKSTLLASGRRTTRDIFSRSMSCIVQAGDSIMGVTEKVFALRNAAWDEALCKDSQGNYCSLKPKPVGSTAINKLAKQPQLSASSRTQLIKIGQQICNSSFSFPRPVPETDVYQKCREIAERAGNIIKGTSYGDPHLITFDGHRYSFQTVGEFVLAKSTDGVFEVQTRQSPVNKSLSLNSAVAMKIGRNRVAFYSKDFPDSNTNTPLRINGQPTTITGNSLSLTGGGIIRKQDDSNYIVEWPTGEKVTVTIYSRGNFKYMDVFPSVFDSQANQMVGLLGNVNSNANDDLRFRNGNILPSKSTYGDLKLINRISPIRLPLGELEKIYLDQLNKDFGNSWRVSQQESLFDYPQGKSTATFTDKAFPDAYLTLDMLSPTQLENARSQCLNSGVDANLLEGCIFDVGFTGFSEFAAHAAKVSNILDIVKTVIPGFKNPIPDILRKIPGLPF